jgi:hypothetical protein
MRALEENAMPPPSLTTHGFTPARALAVLTAVCTATLIAGGCSFETSIHHAPIGAIAGTPLGSVAVNVVNNRPPERGGQTTCVGRVRGGYGNPFPIHEASPADVVRSVQETVSDALLQAGVASNGQNGLQLVATLQDFWLDGFMNYNADVSIEYTLQDSAGVTRWRQSVTSTGGSTITGSVFVGGEQARSAFETALDGIAVQSRDLFRAPDFQDLVRTTSKPSVAPPSAR